MIRLFHKTSLFYTSKYILRQHQWLVIFSLSVILSFVCPAAWSEPLTIVLLPIERAETASTKPFTKADNPFQKLEFDNPKEQWEELNIGYHHWLCGELEKYAEEVGETIHIRFISWKRALHDITETYRGGYDVIVVPSTWTAHLINKKILTSFGDINEANYPPKLLKTCRIKGKKEIYAVPWQLDLRVLFYRSVLTNDPNRLATYKDFRECLLERQEQMQGSADPTWQAPFGVSLDENWDILHNLLGPFFNGHIVEEREGMINRLTAYTLGRSQWKVVFNTGQARKGFEKFLLLSKDGLVHFTSSEQANSQIGWYGLAYGLIEGRYDAVIGGHNMRALFDKIPDVDIRAVPLPQIFPEQPPYSFIGGCHLAVTKAASGRGNEDLSRKLVSYLTSPEVSIALSENTDALPAHKDAFNFFIQKYPQWEAFRIIYDFAQPYPSIPQWANKVERDTVLNSFSMLLDSIADKESDSVIYTQLDEAAKRLQNSLNEGNFPFLIVVVVIIAVSALVVLIIKRRPQWVILRKEFAEARTATDRNHKVLIKDHELIKAQVNNLLEKLRQHTEETIPYILEQLKEASKDVISKFEEFGGELSELFQAVNDNFRHVEQQVKNLTSISHTEVTKLETILERLDTADMNIAEIKDLTGQSHNLLNNIDSRGQQLQTEIDKIFHAAVAAEKKKPLGKCELRADLDYDYEKSRITMKMRLLHNGVDVRTPKANWPEHIIRLFELQVLRKVLEPDRATGINLSDYILLRAYEAKLKRRNTAQHFVAIFRRSVHRFVEPYCTMVNPYGESFDKKEFMIKPFHPSPPAYEFVLDKQVGSFQCNLIKADQEANNLPNYTAQTILDFLRDCRRCVRCWEKLTNTNRNNLNARDIDFIQKGKAMLEKEAQIYAIAENICRSPGGQDALTLYNENLTTVPNIFHTWTSIFENIINQL
jgi:ABC-type glycerol-3-phosphate transport system substrate-binding protein